MPKVKLRDLIKEYEDNEAIINKPTFSVDDEFERLKATYRKNSIKLNIINGIYEVYGNQKILDLIKLVFAKKHEQDEAFDEKTALAEMNENVNARKAEAIFHDAFSPDDNMMPLKEEIRTECRNIGITNSGAVSGYGHKNFYDHMVEKFGEPLKQYLDGKSQPQSYVSWNTINVNVIDIVKDDKLGIDLDKDVTKDYYAFDIHNPYLAKGTNKKPILDIIKNTDYYKNSNVDLSNELAEIDLIIEDSKSVVDFQLNQVRDNLEAETTALNKRVYGNKLEEDKEKNFDSVKFDNTNKTASSVLILKPEVNFKEYEDGIDIKISDKAKEGIILGVKKLKAMKAKTRYSEEGIKAYAFTNLLTINEKIIDKTNEIASINANIEQKEALKAAGNQDAQIDIDITNLKAELEAKTAEIFELNKAYKEEDKHLEELREITRKYFGDSRFANTNVDVTRTTTVPFKYRKDIITNGRMNGLAYWYAIIEESGMTPEEFMKNPGKNFYEFSRRKADINENTLLKNDVKAEVNAGEMSLFDKYRKMLNYNDFADELKMKGDICDNMVRGMDFLISTDEEHFVENNIAYERMNNLMDKQFRFYKQHQLFASKALESYERLFMVDDVPLMDLLADDYFDPFKFEIVKAKPFDLDKYINEHDIKPMDILMKYETMVRAYMDKNKTINPSDPESVYESLSADIKVMTAALAEASAKYLEVNGIDPEKNTDPVVGLLIQSIEDPKKLVRDYIGFKHYTHSNINQKDLKIKLDRLKVSKYNLRPYEKRVETLEKEAITREKNFDTNQLALRKQNERTIDTLLSGNPTPEAYEQVAALQRNYQNSLINHCNILKDDLDKGFISEGFYRKRIEQVMAGVPVGKLKFFGSTVAVKEEEYINEAIENNKSREAAKLEYDLLVARLNNEKQKMAFRLAKKDNRIFKDLNVKKPEYGFNKYETISLEAEENRAFEHNYVVPNEVNIENHEGGIHILDDNSSEARYHMPSRLNAQNNEEVDIYKVLEDNPDEFDNRIEDPKDVYKKKVSIDIGENDNHSKSEFIEEDEKDLVNEKGSVIDNKVKEI